MLYDKIPNTLKPSNIVPQAPGKEYHVVDGVISSTSLQSVSKPSGSSLTATAQRPPSNPHAASTFEINVILFIRTPPILEINTYC